MNKQTEKRNLWLMVCGVLVSKTGSVAFSFAIGLYILKLTGSAMSFGISILLSTIPRLLLSPYAGVLADRISKKQLVVIGDILSGLIVLSLLVFSSLPIVSIYIAIVLLNTVQTFFEVAFQAAQPNIVSDDNLFKLNSYTQSAMSFSNIAGLLIGGLLIQLSVESIIIINGLSFIISGISEAFIDFDYNHQSEQTEAKPVQKQSLWQNYQAAFAFIKTQPIIAYVVLLSLGINFFISFCVAVPLPFMMNQMLGIDELGIAIVNITLSIGVLISSAILGKRGAVKLYKNSYTFAVIVGVVITFMGLPFNLGMAYAPISAVIILAVLHFIAGFSLPAFSVPIVTMEQKLTPENMRGRVFSLIGMLAEIGRPLAIFLSALLVPTITPMTILMFSGAAIIVISVAVMSNDTVKRAFYQQELSALTDDAQ